MCLAVYLAARIVPPLISSDADRPAFHVATLTAEDEPVRVQFSKPHVVYAGSHEGCGCGFDYGQWEGEDPDEVAAAQTTVASLQAYVSRLVASGESIELFACWEGDQSKPPEHRLAITPDDLGGPAFWFEERTFAIISPAV